MKKDLFNEHEIKKYFCDELMNDWERLNKKIIKDKIIFNSVIKYHEKLLKRGLKTSSQKYWNLVDRFIYKNHKKDLEKYFSMNN